MPEPHDWPFEQPARGTVRPWYLTAAGYLAVLFDDSQEAQRSQQGLLEGGMPERDIRLYQAEKILSITALLAGVYAGLVLVLGQLFVGIGTEPPSWTVAGATLVLRPGITWV